VISKMHQNEPENTKIRSVINLAAVKPISLNVAIAVFTFLLYAHSLFSRTVYIYTVIEIFWYCFECCFTKRDTFTRRVLSKALGLC
jgi:hypothetical protein